MYGARLQVLSELTHACSCDETWSLLQEDHNAVFQGTVVYFDERSSIPKLARRI